MIKKSILTVLVVMFLVTVFGGYRLQREAQRVMSDDPQAWEDVIADFEAEDRQSPPEAGQVIFLGSSSIRFWGDKIASDLAEIGAFGRGFGGAKIRDISFYAPRLIADHQPKAVVVYIGANDISGAFGASTISNDEAEKRYRVLLDTLQSLVEVPIYLVAIKPTLRSMERWPIIQDFNARLQAMAALDEQLRYLDANAAVVDATGKPRSDTLLFDGMHLSRKGYVEWGGLIRQRLLADGLAK